MLIVALIPDWETRGLFGDMFGSVNALFSGIALGGIIYAVFLQREDLILQRQELELTRKELSRSAEAQEDSRRALEEQVKALESTARLNWLTTLSAIYYEKERQARDSNDHELANSFRTKRENLVRELESMLLGTTERGD